MVRVCAIGRRDDSLGVVLPLDKIAGAGVEAGGGGSVGESVVCGSGAYGDDLGEWESDRRDGGSFTVGAVCP